MNTVQPMPSDIRYADETAKRLPSESGSRAYPRQPRESEGYLKEQIISEKNVDDIDRDDRDIKRKQVCESWD